MKIFDGNRNGNYDDDIFFNRSNESNLNMNNFNLEE